MLERPSEAATERRAEARDTPSAAMGTILSDAGEEDGTGKVGFGGVLQLPVRFEMRAEDDARATPFGSWIVTVIVEEREEGDEGGRRGRR